MSKYIIISLRAHKTIQFQGQLS